MAKIAFLGLGVMGYPMAGHLVRAGHEICVWNRTGAKARDWKNEYQGNTADTAQVAIAAADFIMSCLGDDPDVREVLSPLFAKAKKGAIFVDHTTTSAILAREMAAKANEKGCHFIDAPISGGQAGAENGQLAIMCGGDVAAFAKAESVMDAYGKVVKRLGEVGAGQLTKMVNQVCIAGIVGALSEGLLLAERAGLNIKDVVGVIGGGAAQSWQMINRHESMAKGEYEFGFAVDWMRKDLRIALEAADSLGLDLQVARLVDGFYAEVQEMGGSRWDTSSLIARLREINQEKSTER